MTFLKPLSGRARLLAAAVATFWTIGAAAQTASTTLALPATAIIFAPIYIAADADLWKKRGLDVKLPLIAGPGATNAMVAGSADFASTAVTSVLRASARGQKLQVIATTHEEFLMELVLSPKAIADRKVDMNADLKTRMEAIKGLRIAIDTPLGMPHAYIKSIARKVGMEADRDFVLTPMQPPNMVSSLGSGAIDGFIFGEPFVSLAHEAGAKTVIRNPRDDQPDLNPYASNIIATRADFCAKSGDICANLIAGLDEALQILRNDPGKSKAIIKGRFPQLSDKALETSFELIRATSPASTRTRIEALDNTQRFALVSGVLKAEEKRDDLKSLINDRYSK